MLLAFLSTTFLAAALLFSVQPMIAKMLLPLLGGSPAVWNTCMVFFQAALLAGYAYAHLLTRLRSVRAQVALHVLMMAAATVLLPIGLPAGHEPQVGASPAGWLLRALAVSVGGPLFVLASAAPLLQSWFAATPHRSARDPYFLYAASNAGSLLALLAYPVLIEPRLGLAGQRGAWSWSYGLFALLATACGVLAARHGRARAATTAVAAAPAPSSGTRLAWIALAFVPCSLMLGATQHLATDVASLPLLWVVPLGLYLLTFVVAFSGWGRRLTWLAAASVPVAGLALAVALAMVDDGLRRQILPQIVVHLAGLLVIGLACHGRLAAMRPDAGRLTEFYLLVAVGGVLGGLFNAIVAPLLFDTIAEYPVAIALACLFGRLPRERSPHWPLHLVAPAVAVVTFFAARAVVPALGVGSDVKLLHIRLEAWLPYLLTAGACLLFARLRVGFALAVTVLLCAPNLELAAEDCLLQQRTFFGVYRVIRERDPDCGLRHEFQHGTTLHGAQCTLEPRRRLPSTYYTRSGPMGDLIDNLARGGGARRIAVVGLGAGTMAAYGRPEWSFTFYEIDPAVIRIATDPALFTFVADSASTIHLQEGDARLQLAAAEDGAYDLIVLDAYGSDAIPVHLITREAAELYLRKLTPDGTLAFHVTNLHLDLASVVAGIAGDLGLVCVLREDGDEGGAAGELKYGSDWVAVARRPAALGSIPADARWKPLPPPPGAAVWTDDYTDLLRVVQW